MCAEIKYFLSFCRISLVDTLSSNPRRADFKVVWLQKDEVSIGPNLWCAVNSDLYLEDLHQGFPSFFRFQELVQGEGRQLRGLQLGCTSSTWIKKRSESHLIQLNDFELLRWWFHILEELCNTPLHGGNTASEC